MAYHITLITNNSNKSVAVTNPAATRDAALIPPNTPYTPERRIEINKMKGNPTYSDAVGTANNIYTYSDNYCFWDNTNSAVNGVGENGLTISFNAKAGDLQVTVNANGTLTFSTASLAAAESA